MRVIAGTARGVRLEAPKGLDVRPTLDRVRESLFSIIGPRLSGARFLDLFAGTGANGVEALSRGAAQSVFVDDSPRSLQAVRANLLRTKLSERGVCTRGKLPSVLERVAGMGDPFDFILADPPYGFESFDVLLEAVGALRLLADSGLIVLEHASRSPLPSALGGFKRVRQEKYGECSLSFFS